MVPRTGSGSGRGLIELEPEYRPEGMATVPLSFPRAIANPGGGIMRKDFIPTQEI